MLKSRGIWIREKTELLESYSKYFNVHAVATLKKGENTSYRDERFQRMWFHHVKSCTFWREVIEANSITIALFLARGNKTKRHGKGKSKHVFDWLSFSDPAGKEAFSCLWAFFNRYKVGINNTLNSSICIYLVGWNSFNVLGRRFDLYREWWLMQNITARMKPPPDTVFE